MKTLEQWADGRCFRNVYEESLLSCVCLNFVAHFFSVSLIIPQPVTFPFPCCEWYEWIGDANLEACEWVTCAFLYRRWSVGYEEISKGICRNDGCFFVLDSSGFVTSRLSVPGCSYFLSPDVCYPERMYFSSSRNLNRRLSPPLSFVTKHYQHESCIFG